MASRQTAEGASTSVGFALPVAPLGLEVSPPPSPPGDLPTLFAKHWGPPAIPWLDGEHDPLLLPREIPGFWLASLAFPLRLTLKTPRTSPALIFRAPRLVWNSDTASDSREWCRRILSQGR